tara:strand:+ start:1645 stop:1869 length:225 start_codon:yes stop_codon:yes gene_type:complete
VPDIEYNFLLPEHLELNRLLAVQNLRSVCSSLLGGTVLLLLAQLASFLLLLLGKSELIAIKSSKSDPSKSKAKI